MATFVQTIDLAIRRPERLSIGVRRPQSIVASAVFLGYIGLLFSALMLVPQLLHTFGRGGDIFLELPLLFRQTTVPGWWRLWGWQLPLPPWPILLVVGFDLVVALLVLIGPIVWRHYCGKWIDRSLLFRLLAYLSPILLFVPVGLSISALLRLVHPSHRLLSLIAEVTSFIFASVFPLVVWGWAMRGLSRALSTIALVSMRQAVVMVALPWLTLGSAGIGLVCLRLKMF